MLREFLRMSRGGNGVAPEITKFTKTAKFTIIRYTIEEMYEIYSKGWKERPSKVTENDKIEEKCEIYDNLPAHLRVTRNLFTLGKMQHTCKK